MIQRIFMLVIILAIVLGGGFYAYKQLVPPPQEEVTGPIYSTKPVTKGNISVGVETTGPLNPSSGGGIQVSGGNYYMEGSSSIAYIIDQVLVEEGDEVKQGDVLVRLAAPTLVSQIETLEEQLLSLKKSLASLMNVPVDQVKQINPDSGIILRAPIGGRVVALNPIEGTKVEQGDVIAQIVDDTRFQITAKLTPLEFEKISEDYVGVLGFQDYFSEGILADIIEINPNPVPTSSSELGKPLPGGNENYEFVYWVTMEADNLGLIQPGMETNIGFIKKEDLGKKNEIDLSKVFWISYTSKVEKYANENNLLSSAEGTVTKIYVNKMAKVKENDPIVALAGQDVREMIQGKIDDIFEKELELQELRSQEGMLEVKAPIDGVVADLSRNPGETVQRGEWLGYIYNPSDMTMWAQVDDIDILLVQQGSSVDVTVDALPGKIFTGKVERVATMGKDQNGMAQFEVVINVQGSAELRPGMQAKAFIKAGSAENVLLVPLEAIFQEDGQNKVEIMQSDGTPKVVTVELGLMNDRVAEVKSGLEEGSLVITGSTADLLPSQKIQSNTLLPNPSDSGQNGENAGNNGDSGNNK